MTAPLFTAAIRKKLIANFRDNQSVETQQDHQPVVKIFTPDAQATWLFSELDPALDQLFGLCDLGIGYPELGYVDLQELTTLRGCLGLPVERDLHFKAKGTLDYYAALARKSGCINA